LTRLETRSIFQARTSTPSAALVVAVTLTVAAARTVIYTIVRCPACGRRIMDVPGEPAVSTRLVDAEHASGRGRVICCPARRCHELVEVIERP